jgi:hypothetical protein
VRFANWSLTMCEYDQFGKRPYMAQPIHLMLIALRTTTSGASNCRIARPCNHVAILGQVWSMSFL